MFPTWLDNESMYLNKPCLIRWLHEVHRARSSFTSLTYPTVQERAFRNCCSNLEKGLHHRFRRHSSACTYFIHNTVQWSAVKLQCKTLCPVLCRFPLRIRAALAPREWLHKPPSGHNWVSGIRKLAVDPLVLGCGVRPFWIRLVWLVYPVGAWSGAWSDWDQEFTGWVLCAADFVALCVLVDFYRSQRFLFLSSCAGLPYLWDWTERAFAPRRQK